MTDEKMYTKKEMVEFIEDLVEDGILSHNGKWINNEVPIWKNVIKPGYDDIFQLRLPQLQEEKGGRVSPGNGDPGG